jgi:hypothetical protein
MLGERDGKDTMKNKEWIRTVVIAGALSALGVGYALAAQKKSVDQRVFELEGKVSALEAEIKMVKSELARTPRLGMQNAR